MSSSYVPRIQRSVFQKKLHLSQYICTLGSGWHQKPVFLFSGRPLFVRLCSVLYQDRKEDMCLVVAVVSNRRSFSSGLCARHGQLSPVQSGPSVPLSLLLRLLLLEVVLLFKQVALDLGGLE